MTPSTATIPRRHGVVQEGHHQASWRPAPRQLRQRLAAASLIAALLVPAILGLAQLVGQRRATHADLGGALALLGVLASIGLLSIDGFGVWQMAQPAADRAEMAALLERIFTSPGVIVPLYLVPLAFPVGLLLLAVGLYRSKLVSPWTAGLVALGILSWFTAEGVQSKPLMVIGVAILALGLGLTGRRVLATSTQHVHPHQAAPHI
jgi:hypothetical protein